MHDPNLEHQLAGSIAQELSIAVVEAYRANDPTIIGRSLEPLAHLGAEELRHIVRVMAAFVGSLAVTIDEQSAGSISATEVIHIAAQAVR